MGKASPRQRSQPAVDVSAPAAKAPVLAPQYPAWDHYMDNSRSMTKSEMLLDVMAKMPKDHPELADVKRRLSSVARANADALSADMKRSAAALHGSGSAAAANEATGAKPTEPKEEEGEGQSDWGEEAMAARSAREPWRTAAPFLPYDVEKEEAILEAERLRRERETGRTLEAGCITGNDVLAMYEQGILSKALFDKMHPVIEEASATRPDGSKLNMSEVLTIEEGDELQAAVARYQDDRRASHPHDVRVSIATLKAMLAGDHIPKSLLPKLRPRIESMDVHTRASLADCLSYEEGHELSDAVRWFEETQGKADSPVTVMFRFKTFKLSYKYLEALIRHTYMPGPVYDKLQPIMAQVCGKVKAGLLSSSDIVDVRNTLTDAESNDLRLSFSYYWKEVELGVEGNGTAARSAARACIKQAAKLEMESLPKADDETLRTKDAYSIATTMVAQLTDDWMRAVRFNFGVFELGSVELAAAIAHGYVRTCLLYKIHRELMGKVRCSYDEHGKLFDSDQVVAAAEIFSEKESNALCAASCRYWGEIARQTMPISEKDRQLRIGHALSIQDQTRRVRRDLRGFLKKQAAEEAKAEAKEAAKRKDDEERAALRKTIQANVDRLRREEKEKGHTPTRKHRELTNLELKGLTAMQLFDMHEALESKVFPERETAERLASYLKRIRLVMNIKERAERGGGSVRLPTSTSDEAAQYAQSTINGPHLCCMVETGYMPEKIYAKLDPLVRSLASDKAALARVTAGGERLDVSEVLNNEEAALLEVAYELFHIEVVEGGCSMRVVLDARMAKRERAATRIQALARGWRMRQLIRVRAAWVDALYNAEPSMSDRHYAATALQANVRGWWVRKVLRPHRAARTVQALARGRRVRQLERVRAAWVDALYDAEPSMPDRHYAATALQAGVRGCLARARLRRQCNPVFRSYMVYDAFLNQVEAKWIDEEPDDAYYLLRAVGWTCFDVAEHRARQTSLGFMRSSPLIYRADGCTDPVAVFEWVSKHRRLNPTQIGKLLRHPDFVALVGVKSIDELLFGARLFDDDYPPEEMLKCTRGDVGWREKRIKGVCCALGLPDRGFEATFRTLGTPPSVITEREAAIYTIRAFMAIEARIGRYFTKFTELWDKACEGLTRRIACHMKTQPRPTPTEEPLRLGELVTWTAMHAKSGKEYTHWGNIVKFTKQGRVAWLADVGSTVLANHSKNDVHKNLDVVQLFPGTFNVSVSMLERPNKLLHAFIEKAVELKRPPKPKPTTATKPSPAPKVFERKKRTLPASLSTPKPPSSANTHRLGDRMVVIAGAAHRARVRVVDMKFDEHSGRHIVSLLQVICAEKRKLHGKLLTTHDVHVIEVLHHFKAEWRRLSLHARIVGKAGLMFRARFDKVHHRHEKAAAKEAARLVRESAPRRCKECDEARPREAYSASQWAKGDGKRTCTACQDAIKAERQRQQDEAKRQEVDALLEAECVICCREAVPPEERAIFECAHWVCNDCASEMHKRNELRSCPYCRHPIEKPQQYVVA